MSKLLNTHQAAAAFNVTTMTLANWRKGSPRRSALPTTKPPKTANPISIWYKAQDLKSWAKKNAIVLHLNPDNMPEEQPSKPGPKAGVKVPVESKKLAAPAKAPSKAKKPASAALPA